MTLRRDWVYRLRQRLNQVDPDSLLSNRLLADTLDTILNLLVRRDADNRKTWRQTDLFTTQTLQFLPGTPGTVRSVQSLPELMQHGTGPFLQLLIPGWTPLTPRQALNQPGHFFYLDGNTLVLTQPQVQQTIVRYWAKPHSTAACQSALDFIMPVPDHLAEPLLTTAVQSLAQAPLAIPDDTYHNQNDLDKKGPAPVGSAPLQGR